MKKTTNIFRRVSIILVLALIITSFAGITNVNEAQAAMTAGNVVYEGNGSLTCGSATLKLENGVLTYIGSTTKKYWDNPVAGTMVVNHNDRLGHAFWYGGIYFAIDMDNGTIIQAYKNASNMYCTKASGNAVYGSSAYMATINTCIIDDEWFYQENMAKMQHLMTRAEFDRISKGEDPTAPTQAPIPTVAPTVAPTPIPTVAPTVVPTVAPTVAPTVVPTVAPIVVPTQEPVPTVMPTVVPTTTPDITIDFEFWWKQYTTGKITWEQFTQIIWQNKWTVNSQTTEKETTYYFYDESGKLIRTERVLVSNKHEEGAGNGSATVSNNGKAEVDIKNEGVGGGKANVKINSSKSKTTTATNKTTFHVKRHGKYVSLTRSVSGKTGVICKVYFNKKKCIAKFNKITYKGIKYVGYTSKSHQIILRTKAGKVKIVARNKGAVGKQYTAKTLKGTWVENVEDTRGLCNRVSNGKNKVMGVKNAQPKKVTSK